MVATETSSDAALRNRHLAALVAFVLRARRVASHSLAADRPALMEFARGRMTVQIRGDGRAMRTVAEYPPEEQLESAAARIRPLLLQSDPVYHSKMLQAVGFFLRDGELDPEDQDKLKDLRREWSRFDSSSRRVLQYSLEVSPTRPLAGETSPPPISDNELAFAWIYGDVVHADAARRAETQAFGVVQRYRAASPVVAGVMVTTIVSLAFIEGLVEQGKIPPLGDAFQEPVISPLSRFEQEADVYLAPVASGSPLPRLGEPLGPEWRRLGDQGFADDEDSSEA